MTDQPPIWNAIFPIGASDPLHLPVRNVEQSLPFYQDILACTIENREDSPTKGIVLQRDHVRLGLRENGGNPEEHSCAIYVDNLDGLYQQLQNQELDLSAIRREVYNNQPLRIFFLRAPDGLCFCFSQHI